MEALPNKVTIKKIILGAIPAKTLWQYKFKFYIRTALGPWQTSEEIVDLLLNSLSECNSASAFESVLNPILEKYIEKNHAKAMSLSILKVGFKAFDAEK